MIKKLAVLSLFVSPLAWTQNQTSNAPSITGNMETTFQYLNEDTLIGANRPASVGLLNSYINVFYRQGGFKAGVRLESYLPRIQGYPNNFDGTGIGMRYVGYENDYVDVTVGNFYEQFGAGLSFRDAKVSSPVFLLRNRFLKRKEGHKAAAAAHLLKVLSSTM